MSKKMAHATSRWTTAYRNQAKRPNPPMLIIIWLSYIIMVVCNITFEMFALGGTTSSQVSNEIFSWFTPAGYVFSIWSVIYIAMAIWLVSFTRDTIKANKAADAVRSAPEHYKGPSQHDTQPEYKQPTSRTYIIPNRYLLSNGTALLFILSCALNVLWLIAWHFRFIATSVVIIACFMAVLGMLYFNVFNATERHVYRIPISLYFSWISVATVANCMYLLTSLGLSELSLVQPVTTVLLAVFFLVQTALMKGGFGDIVFGLVTTWALVGIGIHLMPVSTGIAAACFAIAVGSLLASVIPWEKQGIETRAA